MTDLADALLRLGHLLHAISKDAKTRFPCRTG